MIEANAPLWFFVATLPICFWVAWNDLARMKIPNIAVLALFAVYVVVGAIVLPFDDYLWRYLHLIVVLVIGYVVASFGIAGSGDAKFAAAMAPFVALQDLSTFLFLLGALLITGFVTHRIAARIGAIRALVPDWESWKRTKHFPMGLSLAASLSAYLALAAGGTI